jgi:hypothetical protein
VLSSEWAAEKVMFRTLKTTVALILLGASLMSAQPFAILSDRELAGITARGRLLFEYDQAVWHASDALMATNPPEEALGRYVARKTDTGWVVVFGRLNEKRDAFLVAYRAIQGETIQEFTIRKCDPPERETGFFLAMANAVEVALHDFRGTNRPYNAAVLRAPANRLYVYLVPAQTEEGVYPLGADIRFLVSPDGSMVLRKRQLHEGITGGNMPAGSKVVAGVHTHVLSNVPEDTDVFYVLTRKPSLPEYIRTKNAMYEVSTDGTIHAQPSSKPKPKEQTETVDQKPGNVHLQIPTPATTKKQ